MCVFVIKNLFNYGILGVYFIGFEKLLSRASVALDCRPIVIYAVDVFVD